MVFSQNNSSLTLQNAETLYQKALQSFRVGEFEKGIAIVKRAINLDPNKAEYHKDLGTALLKMGDVKEAAASYSKALNIDPKNIHTLNNLGVLYLNSDDIKNALKTFNKAITIVPNNAELIVNLGKAHHRNNDLDSAKKCFLSAQKLMPQNHEATYNLGLIYKDEKDFELAHQTFKDLISINDKDCKSWNEIGKLLNKSHERSKAIKCFEKALEITPNDFEYSLNLLHALEKSGDLEKALKRVNTLLKSEYKDRPELYEIRSLIARKNGKPNQAIALANKALSSIPQKNYKHAALFYKLGAAYDDIKNSDAAFKAFSEANKLSSYNPDLKRLDFNYFPGLINELCEFCIKEQNVNRVKKNINSSYKDPVFLVGFPRSGTTLLETILKSHQSISVSEEISAIESTYKHAKEYFSHDNRYLEQFSDQQILKLRTFYFETIDLHGKYLNSDVFIDKNPLNMIYAPFIKTIFPDSHFILALRHPKDCVLSCYMQNFEFNNSLIHFLELYSAAKLYDHIFSAWLLYKRHMPLSIYEVRYENLIDSFEESTKAVIRFLGLPWDESINTYYKKAQKDSNVYTPSYSQVTKKIYTSSKSKWENYNSHLHPVSDLLDPWVTKLGY